MDKIDNFTSILSLKEMQLKSLRTQNMQHGIKMSDIVNLKIFI